MPTSTPAIPVSTLTSPTPVPITPIAPPPSTAGTGLAATLAATNDSFTADLATKATSAETNKNSSFEALLKSMLGTPGEVGLTDAAYKGSVDPAEKALKEVNAQLTAEQVATRHTIEKLRAENPEGLFGPALEDKIQEIQSKSLTRQADLAVVQLARQGQYDSAKAIADRAVAAAIEKKKMYNDALRLNYEENKSQFTTAEQRQFEVAQADRERKLDMEAYKEKARYDAMIKAQYSGSGGGSGTYVVGQNPAVDGYIAAINSGKIKITSVPANLRNLVVQGLGGDDQKTSQLITDAGSSAQKLLDDFDKKGKGVVGILGGFAPIPGTAGSDYAINLENLKALLSLENVKYLKGQGQISDAERALLERASSQLDRKQSPAQFKATLEGVVKTLNKPATSVVVVDPNGVSHTFATQADADAFKKEAGIP